ncbi:MAG: redoxin domain-containing protein [Hydrogenophaga sp.]|nr:redoxin domain-containing protein [Hydrogenophaga sp.]
MRRLADHLRREWRQHLGTLLVVLAVVLGVHTWQTRHVPDGPAPDLAFTLIAPDGSRTLTTLSDWRALHPGQPVALHVWADWCPICRTEEHSISRLVPGGRVLTIAMQSGDTDAVARVLAQRGLRWPTAVDPRGDMARLLGFQAVPAFVALDSQGHVRAASVGYTSELGMRLRLWWAGWF